MKVTLLTTTEFGDVPVIYNKVQIITDNNDYFFFKLEKNTKAYPKEYIIDMGISGDDTPTAPSCDRCKNSECTTLGTCYAIWQDVFDKGQNSITSKGNCSISGNCPIC